MSSPTAAIAERLSKLLRLGETDNPSFDQKIVDDAAAAAPGNPVNDIGLFTANSSTTTVINECPQSTERQIVQWLDEVVRQRETNNPASRHNIVGNPAAGTGNLIDSIGLFTANPSTLLPQDFCSTNGLMRSYNNNMEQDMCLLQDMVDSCQRHTEFLSVLEWILRQNPLFVRNMLFHKQGIYCLAKIIKKLKPNDDLACFLTPILAVWICELMTDPTSKVLILNCLAHLGHRANHVLHHKLSVNAYSLATHEDGCISLKQCIDTISGNEKEMLLKQIVNYTVDLAYDTHGNYVLQHVLEQRYEDVNVDIILRLENHFVALSKLKEGSHVVEKCLECCWDFGITVVVVEILRQSPETPYLLARHTFGNYVIQRALRMTAEKPKYRALFNGLVKSLKPRTKELQHTAGGKRVISLMEHEFGLREPICRE